MARRPFLLIAALALLSGCVAGAGPAASAGPPATVVPSAPPPSSPVPTSVRPSVVTAVPPDATLAAEGGDPVVGRLGSYTWDGGGSDSPWLPGAPISVGAGEPLTVLVLGDIAVASWSARRTRGDATSDVEAVPVGSGGPVIRFAAPPRGDWTIAVTIAFASGGSASYAWRLTVT